jgi:hypothetical protein
VFGDQLTRCWKQIVYFGRDHKSAQRVVESPAWRPSPAAPTVSEVPAVTIGNLVIDERGVRVARPQEQAD